MSIKALFFAKFDTQEGPRIIHQVPSDAIAGSHALTEPQKHGASLFNFSDISLFVIPRQGLCGNLITVCKDGYRILGYPICVQSSRYDRNEFIFNFCVVLSEDEEFSPFKSVVQKLANLTRGLEEQSCFLSEDPSRPGEGKIYSLCEMLMEDLNNYCECMIPIDDFNTLNIKLFPTYAPPPPVKAWHVPIFTVRPETVIEDNWDLTMQRIVPYINGISSVKQIAILADADIKLTKRCIKHLLYYNCLLLLDIFSFSAIYAPTSQFANTIALDTEMQRECAAYVNTAFAPSSNSSTNATEAAIPSSSFISSSPSLRDPTNPATYSHTNNNHASNIFPITATGTHLDGVAIVELYSVLTQGQTVKQWYMDHSPSLANIDIRRFITFGVIKGFLYRVHKYAYLSKSSSATTNNNTSTSVTATSSANGSRLFGEIDAPLQLSSTAIPGAGIDMIRSQSTRHTAAYTPPHDSTIPHDLTTSTATSSVAGDDTFHHTDADDQQLPDDADILPYLDGTHCFDQICTELEVSEAWLVERLRSWGSGRKTAVTSSAAASGGAGGEVCIIHR